MNDSLQGFKWYDTAQAEDFKQILSCYGLSLYTVDDRILKGYYYQGKFYNENDMDITAWVNAWMIPQEGESVRPN